MAVNPQMTARILDGALRALARRGRRKLSMIDVCQEAGVARATLYRYFANKDELLAAIGDYVKADAMRNLAEAVAERPAPEERFEVVIGAIANYRWLHPEAVRVLEVEPEFAMGFLRGVFDEWIDFVAGVLEPAAKRTPAVRAGAITERQLAELVLRLGSSTFFIPGADPTAIAGALSALVGMEVIGA